MKANNKILDFVKFLLCHIVIKEAEVSWNFKLGSSGLVMEIHVLYIQNSCFKLNTDRKCKPLYISFASLLGQKFSRNKIMKLVPDLNFF